MEKKDILKSIYRTLGVEEAYTSNGGIGFQLINETMDYNIVIMDSVYNKILEIRKITDDTGVEYPFALMGNIGKIDDKIYFNVSLINVSLDNKSNDGHVKMSDEFNNFLSKNINNYGFCILCHTHPPLKKTTFDKSAYDMIKETNGEKLCLRDVGMNISNSDILQLIGLKISQNSLNNIFYFLQGISLPNGEFNILDIISNDNDQSLLCSVTNVFRLYENKLIPIDNIWNKKDNNKGLNNKI